MPDLQTTYKRHLKYLLYFLAICAFGWGFTDYQDVFAGLALGTAFGVFNLWLINRRMRAFEAAINSGEKFRSLGTMSRLASAALAAIIALEYPEQFNLISVVLGLMTAYIVIVIDFLIHLKRR
ncbi:ATP synthase subunit I [Peribacillus cavernae]|uniref:ATP synthase subunit I n=1 Tax=Peribacillus cavernae TaxID=1674310 RepID=A0A3S0W2Y0_9BACI|nr:ATP synthase subunit I [Peribacillus cavernae]MDQ0218511.1 ATP synthase protein I [Peribacillus cavernae]RUQ31504.1 ATP synthase subunit I [Peribacillus cavernae]